MRNVEERARLKVVRSQADPEAELAARLRDGDEGALSAALDMYWPPLVRYATRLLGDDSDAAKDAVQETFIRLWQGRGKLRAGHSVKAYLYRITHNVVIDARRRRKTRETGARLLHLAERSPITPARAHEQAEVQRSVNEAISRLPERRREAFILVHLHDLSYQEAADILHLSYRTVVNHVVAAMSDLRRHLTPSLEESRR